MSGLNSLVSDAPSMNTSAAGGGGDTSNKELMAQARESLSGNWGMAILGYILYLVFIFSLSFFIAALPALGGMSGAEGNQEVSTLGLGLLIGSNLFSALVSGALIVGFFGFYLGIAQEGEAQLDRLFDGFRRFWRSFGVYFFSGLFILLWSLLFVIPGIIAAYRYMMAYFIIADDEDCGPIEAISRSKRMMAGNKWKLFCLQWRFFFWAILCAFIPIGYLWLIPYVQTSFAQFYEDVKYNA